MEGGTYVFSFLKNFRGVRLFGGGGRFIIFCLDVQGVRLIGRVRLFGTHQYFTFFETSNLFLFEQERSRA